MNILAFRPQGQKADTYDDPFRFDDQWRSVHLFDEIMWNIDHCQEWQVEDEMVWEET